LSQTLAKRELLQAWGIKAWGGLMTATLGHWRATYTPGEWVVLSGPTSLVVLEPPSREWAPLINTLWDQVVASSSITDLASLLATFKMDQLPTFGAFFWTADGMRSLVRGQISVIDLATGNVVADGHGIQTWSEVGLAGVEQVRVDLAHEGDVTLLELPLVVGAVRASSVVLDASEGVQVRSPQGQLTTAEAQSNQSEAPGEPSTEPFSEQSTEPLPEVVASAAAEPMQVPSESAEEAGADAPSPQTAELSATEIAALANAETELMSSPFDEPASDTEPDLAEPAVAEHDVAEPDVPGGYAGPQKLEHAVALNLAGEDAAELVASPAPHSDASPHSSEPAILAVLCPDGHASAPDATSCRVCGGPVGTQAPQLVGPPVLAVLRASNGTSAEVDRTVLIGRAPSSDRSSSQTPRLMTVPSPNHDISRTHLEVSPDDWQVVVTDLNSTNGTILVPPGASDGQQLAPGERIPAQVGSVMELGDGVSVLIDFPQ
jgi:FHA domain-containing protein